MGTASANFLTSHCLPNLQDATKVRDSLEVVKLPNKKHRASYAIHGIHKCETNTVQEMGNRQLGIRINGEQWDNASEAV
jgi:hypothetical protein